MNSVNNREIALLRDEAKRTNDFMKSRLEENEKILKYNVDTLSQEIIKISKETYYEFDMIDSKLSEYFNFIIGEI